MSIWFITARADLCACRELRRSSVLKTNQKKKNCNLHHDGHKCRIQTHTKHTHSLKQRFYSSRVFKVSCRSLKMFSLFLEKSGMEGVLLTVSQSSERRHRSRADNIYHTPLWGRPSAVTYVALSCCVYACVCVSMKVRGSSSRQLFG